MFKKTMVILAALVLGLTFVVGCSGDRYDKQQFGGVQDTTYVVRSNGGSAVQYGNYVYFLNGTRGYDDTDATANVFGSVVKGAVYRAELLGEKADGEFVVKRDSVTRLGLKTHTEKDYRNEDTDVVDVERIAPKTAGTSGYGGGGLFLYGNSLYYASPNNLRNKAGSVQYLKTDFFRMTLDGETTPLYTTESDSAESPYMFYSKGDSVYLVVLDGTNLISVQVNKKSGKVEEKRRLAEDVTQAVLPTKPVYYDGISENTIYDFIYFKRAATKDDLTQTGDVLEFMRPDGSNRTIFEASSASSYTLETVSDGYLFYRKPVNYTESLYARNLHDALAQADEQYASDPYNTGRTDVERRALTSSDLSSLTVYPFVPGYDFIAADGSAGGVGVSDSIDLLAIGGSDSNKTLSLYVDGVNAGTIATGSAISVDCVYGNYLFYTADGTLKQTYIGAGSDLGSTDIASGVNAGTYGADVAGGYLIYFGELSSDVTDYAFFYDIEGPDGDNDPLFAGELANGEVVSRTESLTVVEQPTKTQYLRGESLDLSGLVVEANFYADEDGERPEPLRIDVTPDMVSGFDSSVAGDITLTVTYDKKTVDFTVTILDQQAAKSCSTVAPVGPWFYLGGGGALLLVAGALFVRRRKAA